MSVLYLFSREIADVKLDESIAKGSGQCFTTTIGPWSKVVVDGYEGVVGGAG